LLSPPDPVLRGPCDVRQYSFVISNRFAYINLYLHVNISERVLILTQIVYVVFRLLLLLLLAGVKHTGNCSNKFNERAGSRKTLVL